MSETLAQRFEAMIPRLETERLILRGPRPSDFEAYATYQESERSVFTGGPMDRNLAWRAFCAIPGHWIQRGYGVFVLELKETGEPIGTSGPYFPEGWPEPEIAWTIWSAGHEGQGLANEAARAGRAYAYDMLGWPGAISMILVGNTRSEELAERLGCTREGGFVHAQFGPTSIWRHPAPGDLADGGLEAYA